MSFCSLIKGITPKIRMLCFVLINSVILNLWCIWILRITVQSPSRFFPPFTDLCTTSRKVCRDCKDLVCLRILPSFFPACSRDTFLATLSLVILLSLSLPLSLCLSVSLSLSLTPLSLSVSLSLSLSLCPPPPPPPPIYAFVLVHTLRAVKRFSQSRTPQRR